jgi:hypothetical protein
VQARPGLLKIPRPHCLSLFDEGPQMPDQAARIAAAGVSRPEPHRFRPILRASVPDPHDERQAWLPFQQKRDDLPFFETGDGGLSHGDIRIPVFEGGCSFLPVSAQDAPDSRQAFRRFDHSLHVSIVGDQQDMLSPHRR